MKTKRPFPVNVLLFLLLFLSLGALFGGAVNFVLFVHTGYILLGLSIVCIALLPSVRQYYFID